MAIRTNKKKCTATVSGDMTIYTSAEYQQALVGACPAGKEFKLDLSEVEEMDTSGLQLLLSLQHHMTGSAKGLQLEAASDVVKNVFALTRIDGVQRTASEEQLS
jgi:anti-anti-sigma factor